MTASDHAAPPGFDARYRADPDPWRVATSTYERRKRAVLLASLPRERYAAAWEPGCGIGVLTRELADRAARVDADDPSARAVELAAARCAGLDHVTVHRSGLPDCPLDDPADLVVAAEFLYYLPDLDACTDVLWQALAPGGDLAVLHWRHAAEDTFLSGSSTQDRVARLLADRGARRLVHHDDEHFVLDIHRRPDDPRP